MNLFERLRLLIQAAVSDLFSEDPPAGQPAGGQDGAWAGAASLRAGAAGRLEARLVQAQASLDSLRVALAQADARRRQAAQEWQAAQAQLQALDEQVDDALQAGQEDLARQRLEALQHRRALAGDLERRAREYTQAAEDLRSEVDALQAGLADARAKARRLAEAEHSAAGLEQAGLLRRELGRELERLAEDLRRGEAQVARRADQAAARRELEHK